MAEVEHTETAPTCAPKTTTSDILQPNHRCRRRQMVAIEWIGRLTHPDQTSAGPASRGGRAAARTRCYSNPYSTHRSNLLESLG